VESNSDHANITTGSGGASLLKVGGTTANINVTDGFVRFVEVYDDTAVTLTARGDIGSAVLDDGNDSVTVSNGGRIALLDVRRSTNDITVETGSWINVLQSYQGSNTVTVNGDARIRTISMDEGDSTIDANADAHVSIMNLYRGSFTVTTETGFLRGGRGKSDHCLRWLA